MFVTNDLPGNVYHRQHTQLSRGTDTARTAPASAAAAADADPNQRCFGGENIAWVSSDIGFNLAVLSSCFMFAAARLDMRIRISKIPRCQRLCAIADEILAALHAISLVQVCNKAPYRPCIMDDVLSVYLLLI